MNRIIVTGGAGFIGSAVVRYLVRRTEDYVCVVDKLTYAGNMENLPYDVQRNPRYKFEKVDICDKENMERIFNEFQPNIIMHLAAESHVDRSIDGPAEFINTNIVGTFNLLEVTRKYYNNISPEDQRKFRFVHISTDEVFGDLGTLDGYFNERTAYDPHSPYSASKASSDHLVKAWYRTYELPTIVTNCSNNYGPYQFPEKLIPLTILHALEGKEIPIYGGGLQIRDWLYVEDHVKALYLIATKGHPGESYNIGGWNERTNMEVVTTICDILDRKEPRDGGRSYKELIRYVADRPGHDTRYAIDPTKIHIELGWEPEETFEDGIEKTVSWYIGHRYSWCAHVLNGSYKMERLGELK